MLSRKAICLWIFLALPLVALVASGVSLGQGGGAVETAGADGPAPLSTKASGEGTVEPDVNAAPSRPARPVAVPTLDKPGKGSEIELILKALNDERALAEAQLKGAEARLKEVRAQFQQAISRYETLRTGNPMNLELRMPAGASYVLSAGRRVHHEHTRKHDPQMAKLLEQDSTLDKEARALVQQCRKGTDKEKRAELKARLAELTEKHFELRQERRELQIAQLETELEKVRATIDKRNDARELIIRRRVSQLLGEKDELDWGPSAASPLRAPVRAPQATRVQPVYPAPSASPAR